MGRYREQYLRAFQTLGRELRPADALSADVIAAAEGRLGLRAPKALAEFYHVAGRAEDYTCAFNRLLPPSEWTMDVGESLSQSGPSRRRRSSPPSAGTRGSANQTAGVSSKSLFHRGIGRAGARRSRNMYDQPWGECSRHLGLVRLLWPGA